MNGSEESIKIIADAMKAGEGVYLGAMLFGISEAMHKCLDNIKSYQDMLEDELDNDPVLMSYLEAERENLARLEHIVGSSSELLAQSKGGERVHLITLIEGVQARIIKQNNAAMEELPMNVDDDLFVRCSPFQIQQLLFELLSLIGMNRRSTEKPWNIFARSIVLGKNELGILNIRNEQNANFVMLKMSVEDKDLPLFGTYQPIQDSIANGQDMTVAMTKIVEWLGLAQLNGCHLLVNRESPRNGFVLLFPEIRNWEPGTDPLSFFGCRKNDDPKTILLVDDEDMIWDVISEMLQELGYNVILAGNGREAVQIYSGNPGQFDLVILDMLMPEIGGKEVFYILKNIDPNVKVLISSGYVSEDQIQDVINDGAAGFLRKPYRMADLAKKIRSIIG